MRLSKEKILFSLTINLFFAITLIVYGPYEIFIGNSNDFQFTFRDFWWMSVVVAVIYLLITVGIFSLLPEKVCYICNLFVFSFAFCCYVQAMLLNSKMRSLIGEEIDWDSVTKYTNLLIWIVIFIVLFLLQSVMKKNWKILVQFVSLALVAMQLVALSSLLLTTNVMREKKDGYVSREHMLELSENQNVVVFILDFFEGRTMDAILAESPDFLAPLDGFTYFPNATSVYSRTYPSVDYLLTGYRCYFDKPPHDWTNEASDNSDFIPALSRHDIDIGIYTTDRHLGNGLRGLMNNYEESKLSVSFSNMIKYLAKMILYRDMPYIIKRIFEYDPAELNNEVVLDVTSEQDSVIGSDKERYQTFADEWFYEKLTNERLNLSERKGCFRFYHLGGPHLDLTDLYTRAANGRRSLEIVYAYLDQMRNLGIYEQSTIIITTDHGNSGGGDTLDMPHQTAVPLFLIKPSGSANTEVAISSAPISQTDFIPTVLNGFGISYDGSTVFDIPEEAERDRYYYYTALYSDEDGEIELREYLVDGDAREPSSYHFTGKKWDVLYSVNKIADR